MKETGSRVPKTLIILGYAFSLIFLPLVWIDSKGDDVAQAIIGMSIILLIVWMIVFALIQLRIKSLLPYIKNRVVLKFTVLATIMILIEEAITTSITNLAEPLFNVSSTEAYITASTNYLDVILNHSVIVFIPMFICWGFIIKKYKFNYLWVYLLFGITGTLSETLSFGVGSLIAIGFWINIYGLMIYLPAYLVRVKNRIKPTWWFYVVMIILPIIVALPIVIIKAT